MNPEQVVRALDKLIGETDVNGIGKQIVMELVAVRERVNSIVIDGAIHG